MLEQKIKVSESELEILKVLWNYKKATSTQIVEELIDKTNWKPKTIQTLITRLVAKSILRVDKSNKKSYIYSSNISEKEYKKIANESFVNKLYNGSVNLMISTFINDKNLSHEDINDLKKLLDNDD